MREIAWATILKTGPGISIQDLGRLGQSKFGLPISGVMDEKSFRWINHVLKNPTNAAVLEISQPGFQIQFDAPTKISIAGASANVRLNGSELVNSALISIQSGDILEIGAFLSGARIYLGIKSGFQTQEILGSRSFYGEITEETHLSKGARIPYLPNQGRSENSSAKAKWTPYWFQTEELFAYAGPDFHLLEAQTREELIQKKFTISKLSNRMGIQLTELLENRLPELPTNPVYPGTVQLTSGGKLIILAQDAQVTGGYPRVLQLTEESQAILAQKRPGDSICFNLIPL
jgi:biotin-dependent carboxylase-like uncharacterized protein